MTNMNLYSRGDKAFVILNMVLIGLFTISTLYPFIYIASLSMSTGFEARAGNVILTPVGFTLEAYKRVLSEPLFWTSYKNTFIYTIGGTLMSLAFIIPGAYALSRPQLYGRRFWNLMVAFTMWFNAGMIPFFLNMRDLGLLDSYFGIIIGFAVNGFNIILLRNFFEGIPQIVRGSRTDGRRQRIPGAVEGLHAALQAGHRHGRAVLHRVALERLLLGDGAACRTKTRSRCRSTCATSSSS